MSRRTSNESTKSASSTGDKSSGSRKGGKTSKNESSGEFNWDKYLQQTGLEAAPGVCFKHDCSQEALENKFEMFQKMEAKDARNPSAISVATIVQIQGPRLCLRLDGTDGCNDFWRLVNSKDIYPLGTCEAHGGLLQPPLGYTRNVSTWPAFLQRKLQGANQAHTDAFLPEPEGPKTNRFKVGMKLEAVDLKNPQLICPATVGEVVGDQIFVSFDGWRGAFDYWCNFDSRDIFPVDWCHNNNHPIQSPGKKGDNPIIVDKLKAVIEENKRQTRSVTNNPETKSISAKVFPMESSSAPSREKPLRRRALEKIARSKQEKPEKKEEEEKVVPETPSKSHTSASTNSDWSVSSDDSDSSQDSDETKDNKEEKPKTSPTTPEDKKEPGESPCKSSSEVKTPEHNYSKEEPASVSQVPKEDRRKWEVPKEDRRKWERKLWRQKRKQRRLAKALKRAGRLIEEGDIGVLVEGAVGVNFTPEQIALLTSSQRKRLGSAIEGEALKLKKKKKRKRVCDATYTRMEGFGLKPADPNPATTPLGKTPTSPSFLDALTPTPTSLFGGDRSRIVRSATEGWPTRLQLQRGPVVTSDNKLGFETATFASKTQKFDTSAFASKTQESEIIKTPTEHVTMAQCVSTTTTEMDTSQATIDDVTESQEAKPVCSTPPPSVSSTSQMKDDVTKTTNADDAVSSTTNPPSHEPSSIALTSLPEAEAHSSSVTSSQQMVTSSRRRSRNPSKWSIDDVIMYVKEKESALHNYLHLFQKHEIDGAAFLLLNSNNIVKYMNLKLGPALKLCNLVGELNKQIVRRKHK